MALGTTSYTCLPPSPAPSLLSPPAPGISIWPDTPILAGRVRDNPEEGTAPSTATISICKTRRLRPGNRVCDWVLFFAFPPSGVCPLSCALPGSHFSGVKTEFPVLAQLELWRCSYVLWVPASSLLTPFWVSVSEITLSQI